jgi:AAHS family benzoate transporter-like MFS transporter
MRTIDVNALIDGARMNRFHWRVLFWCALIVVFDGYDLVVYGVVLPTLMREWDLSPMQAGAMGSYALFGMMLGALIFGPLSDRIGRKRAIMICVILFSGFTVLNGFVRTPGEFSVCRFFAGLGIGGVMPNVVALMNEFSPKKIRSTLVALMFSGYSVGGMLSATLGIALLPSFGWRAVFYVAVVPLLLLPLILRFLPESVGFMVRQGREEEARKTLQRLAPEYQGQPDDFLELSLNKQAGGAVPQLFRQGRALNTLMFWLTFFCCLLMSYALSSWLPKLMTNAGYGFDSSLKFLLVLNIGAIVGAVGGGWLGDRLQLSRVLVVFFIVAAVCISLMGFKSPQWILYGLVAITGATTIGAQILAYACVAQFYPMSIRSTGIGWASGVGRIGAIIGPLLGGVLLGLQLPLHLNFMVFAVPGTVAAVAMCFVRMRKAGDNPSVSLSAQPQS